MRKIVLPIILVIFCLTAKCQEVAPVVDISGGLLLGGTLNGSLEMAEGIAAYVKGNEIYKVYGTDALIGTYKGGEAYSFGEPCPEIWSVDITAPTDNYLFPVGIACSWDPFPKTFKVMSNNVQTYKDATAVLLKNEGLNEPDVEIQKIISTDLENDGVEEVVIFASNMSDVVDSRCTAGDYSLVFLRKIVDGKVENIVLAGEIYTDPDQMPTKYELMAILDIDNDGIYEIIVHYRYYEGWGTSVVKIRGGKGELLLSEGCGV